MPTPLAAPVVMVGSGLVALLLGSVVTRASGLALAVATIMLPLIATGYVSSAGYLGGSVGMPLSGNLWPGPTPEAIAVGNGVITVLLLGAVVFVSSRILHSDIGLELYALGVDEWTAAAMGISTPRRKLELFVLGSVFAALGGAVYAGTELSRLRMLVSAAAELSLLIMLFVGGLEHPRGGRGRAGRAVRVRGERVGQRQHPARRGGPDHRGAPGRPRGPGRDRRHAAGPAGAAPGGPGSPAGPAGVPAAGSAAPPPAAACAGDRLAAPGRRRGCPPLLECAGVSKGYGGLHVLDAVSLALPAWAGTGCAARTAPGSPRCSA